MENLLYKIGISLIPGVGDVTAKKLIAYCGGVEEVFNEKKTALLKIAGVGEKLANEIIAQSVLQRAEQEIKFIEKNNITPLFYLDEAYPSRLKFCDDAPVILYCKGKMDFNNPKIISIVGTRNATDYGKKICEQLVHDLAIHNPIIISGLAYGIDVAAHKAALNNNLQTIGILAHGLDSLYPPLHLQTSNKMQENGGIATEFLSETKADKENFPKRNRIVAGIADAVVVIEASKKGGALITAELANGYNRDVFAIPGNIGETYSEGCNKLIKINKAVLLESAKDIEYILGWEQEKNKPKKVQKEMFVQLTEDEQRLVNLLGEQKNYHIDELSYKSEFSTGVLSGILLNLEFKGLVKSLPGRVFELA